MAFRYLSATSALIYGLLLAYVIVTQGLSYGFHWHDYWRLILTLTALFGAGMAFSGRSSFWVLVTMGLVLLADLQQLVFILPSVVAGAWNYSKADFFVFSLTFLPVLAALFSLITVFANAKIKIAIE